MQDGSYNSLDDATFVTWSLFVGGICYEDVRTRVRARICKDEEVRRCRAQDEGAGITTIRTRVIFVLVKNKTRLV